MSTPGAPVRPATDRACDRPGLDLVERGEARFQEGALEEAVDLFLAALDADPRSTRARNDLGVVLHAIGRVEDALTTFEAALTLDPADATALANKARVLSALERPLEAARCLRAALALAPNDEDALALAAELGLPHPRTGGEAAADPRADAELDEALQAAGWEDVDGAVALSVLVRTCAEAPGLIALLDRLALQSLGATRYEVVVVDDGAPQELARALEGWWTRHPLRVVRRAPGDGSSPWRIAVDEARGRWAVLYEDGCAPLSEALREHLLAQARSGAPTLVAGALGGRARREDVGLGANVSLPLATLRDALATPPPALPGLERGTLLPEVGVDVARAIQPRATDGGAPPSERPVFVLGCAYRCGSTLLQRLLSSGPELFVWGENMGLSDLLASARERVEGWRWESYQEDQWRALEERGLSGWICNLQPAPFPRALDASLRAFYLEYYAAQTRRLGRGRWGFKEVHHGADTARFLLALFPAARIVFLERDPVDVLASVATTDWYGTVGRAPRVLALWRENVESMRALRDPRVLTLRYEDLAADPEGALARLARHVEVPLDRLDASLLARKVRGFDAGPRLGPEELASLRQPAFVRAAAALGYDVLSHARLATPRPMEPAAWQDEAGVREGEEGPRGIVADGHRAYVGGMWDEIGRLQLEFLVAQGLRPQDRLLDVGCGALRGGVHFVRYLERGNYLGLDKEPLLLERGVREELGLELFEEKQPLLHAADDFDLSRFPRAPGFALAQSLFTHLTAADIERCLQRVRAFVAPGCRFFATFFECETPQQNLPSSHARRGFRYTRGEMEALGERQGWQARYLGGWGHPRDQRMIEYRAR